MEQEFTQRDLTLPQGLWLQALLHSGLLGILSKIPFPACPFLLPPVLSLCSIPAFHCMSEVAAIPWIGQVERFGCWILVSPARVTLEHRNVAVQVEFIHKLHM